MTNFRRRLNQKAQNPIVSLSIAFLLSIWYFTLGTSNVSAAEFLTAYDVGYNVAASRATHVAQTITLTNNSPDHYATDFTLQINTTDLKDIHAYDSSNNELPNSISENSITVKFTDTLVGQGTDRQFRIEYNSPNLTQKIGSLWEINLPAFNETTDNSALTSYKTTVAVDKSLGPQHYVVPAPSETAHTNTQWVYHLNSTTQNLSPITFVFGAFQLYNIKLQYHLANDSDTARSIPIALPPDFPPYQTIYISNLSPLPEKIQTDPDGNYLAYYSLQPGETLTITYTGQVKISNRTLPPKQDKTHDLSDLTLYTIPDKFWESNAEEIKAMAQNLQTAQAIYDFVVKNLNYNQQRISPEIKRFGALRALNDKDNAVCMEFTDLTIALLRAAGIPAREVDGYAYTDRDVTSTTKPTVTDVLHAWVMYWDPKTNHWRQIDPTWGSTTRRDYFSSLDTSHIIFAIKGLSSETPYPAGAYKTLGASTSSEDVKVAPASELIHDVRTFTSWQSDFAHQKLPWWVKLWQWIKSLFR